MKFKVFIVRLLFVLHTIVGFYGLYKFALEQNWSLAIIWLLCSILAFGLSFINLKTLQNYND